MKLIGKFAIDRGSFLTGGGTIVTLRFRAEKTGKTTITVKNIEATNLEDEIRPRDASTTVTVNPKETPPPTQTPQPPDNTPNPTNTPPVVPTPTQTPPQNNNQGNNNNSNGNNQNSRPNGGNSNNGTSSNGANTNQTPTPDVTPEQTPEATPDTTPTSKPSITPDNDDFDNLKGDVTLKKQEGKDGSKTMIYILCIILAIIIITTIGLFCYLKIRNKKIKKLGGKI